MELLLKKQYCLIASSWGKDYPQINIFLATVGRVERNLKAFQIKTTARLGGRAIGKTLSSIHKSLDGSQCAEQWQEEWPTGRSKVWLLWRQN